MPTTPAPYSLEHMGASPATVSKDATGVCQPASPKGAEEREPSPQVAVGERRLGHSHDLTFFSRVHRVQREIEAGRTVPDSDLLQHAKDLTELLEQAWECFLDSGNHFAYDTAMKRMRQRDAARRLLSREHLNKYECQTFGDLADMRSK